MNRYIALGSTALLIGLLVYWGTLHTKIENRDAEIADLVQDTTRYGQRYRMLLATQRADRAALDLVDKWVLETQAERKADSLQLEHLSRSAEAWRARALTTPIDTLYVRQPLPEGETECPALAIVDYRSWLDALDERMPLYEP